MHANSEDLAMSLALRNSRALAAGQAAWDNALPPEDDGRSEYIDEQAGQLLIGWDADGISFLPHRGMADFASRADELIADEDSEHLVVQIVVALLARDTEKAIELADRFQPALAELAEDMVITALENRA